MPVQTQPNRSELQACAANRKLLSDALLEARAVGPEALGPGVREAAARERRPQQLATDLLEPLFAAALAQNHQALLCANQQGSEVEP